MIARTTATRNDRSRCSCRAWGCSWRLCRATPQEREDRKRCKHEKKAWVGVTPCHQPSTLPPPTFFHKDEVPLQVSPGHHLTIEWLRWLEAGDSRRTSTHLGNPDDTAASTIPRGRWCVVGRQLGSNMDLHLCRQPLTEREGLGRERIAARCHGPNGRACIRTTGQVVHRIELACSCGLADVGGWDEGREEHGPAEQRGRGEIPLSGRRRGLRRSESRLGRVVEGRKPAVVIILDIIH